MRTLVKRVMMFLCGIPMVPLILLSKLGTVVFHSDVFFVFISQSISLIPSPIGSWCRVVFYWGTMEEFHLDSVVGFGAVLVSVLTRVGSKCHISDHSIIGYSHIGNNVSISSKVSLIAGRYQHNFSDPTSAVLNDPALECLEIGNGVFFGEGCICMADVGAGSIVGAGSVVVKNIPAYSIAVGNPARVVKTRRLDGPWTAVPRDKN